MIVSQATNSDRSWRKINTEELQVNDSGELRQAVSDMSNLQPDGENPSGRIEALKALDHLGHDGSRLFTEP